MLWDLPDATAPFNDARADRLYERTVNTAKCLRVCKFFSQSRSDFNFVPHPEQRESTRTLVGEISGKTSYSFKLVCVLGAPFTAHRVCTSLLTRFTTVALAVALRFSLNVGSAGTFKCEVHVENLPVTLDAHDSGRYVSTCDTR